MRRHTLEQAMCAAASVALACGRRWQATRPTRQHSRRNFALLAALRSGQALIAPDQAALELLCT